LVVVGAVVAGYDGAGVTSTVVVDGTVVGSGQPGLVDTVGSVQTVVDGVISIDVGSGLPGLVDTVGAGRPVVGTGRVDDDCGWPGLVVTDVVGTGRVVDDVGVGASAPPPEASAIVGTAMPSPPSTTAPATTTSRLRTCCS
jgi:hypothetical protein